MKSKDNLVQNQDMYSKDSLFPNKIIDNITIVIVSNILVFFNLLLIVPIYYLKLFEKCGTIKFNNVITKNIIKSTFLSKS